MIQCLIDNKICSSTNKKCKVCKLEECKELIRLIETQEEYEHRKKLKSIKAQLPNNCKNCSFLQILDYSKEKVRCPYMLEKCLLYDIEVKNNVKIYDK